MRRWLVLATTHLAVLALGFGAGIYALYASGDVTLNRAWIPPLYLTWD